MAKASKRTNSFREQVSREDTYAIDEALGLVKNMATAKFRESVDVAVNLGVDPRKSDQVVRGSTVLPHGTGKDVRVAVFAQGDNAEKALAAGADVVGFEDLAERPILGSDRCFFCACWRLLSHLLFCSGFLWFIYAPGVWLFCNCRKGIFERN